jgi:hypothetical protein
MFRTVSETSALAKNSEGELNLMADLEPKETEEVVKEVVEPNHEKKVEKVTNGNVSIKNIEKKNKSVIGINGIIKFNEEGIAEVSNEDSKRLLSFPGYILVK